MTKIQVPTFYALGQTRLPVISSATAVGLKIAASLLLIAFLPRWEIDPFLGLALSTSLAAWVNFAILAIGLRRRIGSLRGLKVFGTTLKVLIISVTMGFACHAFNGWTENAFAGGGIFGEIARVLAAVALGIALVGIGAQLLKVPEARLVFDRLRRRIGGAS